MEIGARHEDNMWIKESQLATTTGQKFGIETQREGKHGEEDRRAISCTGWGEPSKIYFV